MKRYRRLLAMLMVLFLAATTTPALVEAQEQPSGERERMESPPIQSRSTMQVVDESGIREAINAPGGVGVEINADPGAIGVTASGYGPMPNNGGTALALSTGNVSGAFHEGAHPGDLLSMSLSAAPRGVTGNDMTQVTLTFEPAANAKCVAIDAVFGSEEYPDYIGSRYNDVFTVEVGESALSVNGGTNIVDAPNNVAFDSEGQVLSVNTAYGLSEASEDFGSTALNGLTEQLTVSAPVKNGADGKMRLILSIQDVGDDVVDSVVLLDNFRYLYNDSCTSGATPVKDSDGDGLPDEWELNGIDGLDLKAMGADPYRKDIFIQADWMEIPASKPKFPFFGGSPAVSLKPNSEAMKDVMRAFRDAPTADPNPGDGITIKPGINLHVDSGGDSVMNIFTGDKWGSHSRAKVVPHTWRLGAEPTVKSIREDFENRASLSDARAKVFRHALFIDKFNDGKDYSSSGIALTSFESATYTGTKFAVAKNSSPKGLLSRGAEAGTFMHELGHVLGLKHGGGDHVGYKPNYASVMNYSFQQSGIFGPRRLDYSREVSTMLDENSLSEEDGVLNTTQMAQTVHYCPVLWSSVPKARKSSVNAVDWNCSGGIDGGRVSYDVTKDETDAAGNLVDTRSKLHGWHDWGNIRFDGYGIGGQGVDEPFEPAPLESELTFEEAAKKEILAAEGSSMVNLVGPGTLLVNEEGQMLHVEVLNPTPEEISANVTVSIPGLDFTVTEAVTVPAMSDGALGATRIEIEAPVRLEPGSEEISIETPGELGARFDSSIEFVTLSDEEIDQLRDYLNSEESEDVDDDVRRTVLDALGDGAPTDNPPGGGSSDSSSDIFGSSGSLGGN